MSYPAVWGCLRGVVWAGYGGVAGVGVRAKDRGEQGEYVDMMEYEVGVLLKCVLVLLEFC